MPGREAGKDGNLMYTNHKKRHLDKRMFGKSILFFWLTTTMAFCSPTPTQQVTKAAPTGTVYYVDFVHGSDTKESAAYEIPYFFSSLEIH